MISLINQRINSSMSRFSCYPPTPHWATVCHCLPHHSEVSLLVMANRGFLRLNALACAAGVAELSPRVAQGLQLDRSIAGERLGAALKLTGATLSSLEPTLQGPGLP